jgi:hypothetical protein
MSAMGHKQTYALQQAMSALPLIATEIADIRKRPCLLYPRKRHVQCNGPCLLRAKSGLAASVTQLGDLRAEPNSQQFGAH